jgi:hypothetical protein
MTGNDARPGTIDRMGESQTLGDEHLADEVGRVVRVADPVPASWKAAARAAYAWTAIAGDPARLAYDSLVTGADEGVAARRSGADGDGPQPLSGSVPRSLRYTCGQSAVELDLDVGSDKLRVVGRVVPAASVEVVAHWPGGRRSVASDAAGGFRFDELPRRPLCFEVTGPVPVKSGWVVA